LGALYVGFKQNEINQNILDLQHAVSLEITHQPQRLNISNKGQTNIWLWGTRLADAAPSYEQQPRLITPGGFYYLIADKLEALIVKNIGQNGNTVVPLEVFVAGQNGKKWIVRTLLFAVVTNGVVQIHTQTVSATQTDWPAAPPK
jgi:hypothetical protein